MGITIVGLGPGSSDLMSLGAYNALKSKNAQIWLRTEKHPVVQFLLQEGISFQTMDQYYIKCGSFEEVYDNIVKKLIDLSYESDLVYGVPGNPFVAEKTVLKVVEECEKLGIFYKVIPSMSFIDASIVCAKENLMNGFTLLDAMDLRVEDIDPSRQVLIAQVYDRLIASEVKLTLLEFYDENSITYLINNAGMENAEVLQCSLCEMDALNWDFNHLTSVWIVGCEGKPLNSFSGLIDIIKKLRGENGCPWDKKQTHESLKPFLLEEAQELIEAIDRKDEDNMVEELGDILLQVVLHGQIGKESGAFDIKDIVKSISEKMIRRHPHVFGNIIANSEEEVLKIWNEIKKGEKQRKSF